MVKRLEKANLNIISLHASHFLYGNPVFPLSPPALRSLSPDICLTLIDDVYACKQRLKSAGYPYRFEQLLTWRDVECGAADNLAIICGTENILLAVKHPAIGVYRLLFEPHRPRVYSASQITAVRNDLRLRDEIETHRKKLHQEFVVFDPITIDDRILINELSGRIRQKKLSIGSKLRWPCDFSGLGRDYRSLVAEDSALFPFTIDVKEARDLAALLEQRSFRNVIDAQITHRDFRYIDQSDVVSAYRPRLNGHESSGVAAEKRYAAGTGERPVIEYSTSNDLRMFSHDAGSRPFSTPLLGPACDTLEQFYSKLKEVATTEADRRCAAPKSHCRKFESFRKAFCR